MSKILIYTAILIFTSHCIFQSENGIANQTDTSKIAKNLTDTSKAIIENYSNERIADQQGNSNIDQNLLDSLKSIMDSYSRECFKIELSFTGYESESEENWYYDSLGVICGYHLTWNMEGQSGEAFHWYENGKLIAMYDEKQGNSDDQDITFLKKPDDSEKLKSYDDGAKSMEQKIFKLIDDNPAKKTENEYDISVTLEETVNYGSDFTQTTKVYIDKPLFDILFTR